MGALAGRGIPNDSIESVRVTGTGCSVTMYQHGDDSGWALTLTEGDYTCSDLQSMGGQCNDMTTCRIEHDGPAEEEVCEAVEYVGCYRDDGSRDLNEGPHQYGYTPETCSEACADYAYFSLQNGGWCACGHKYGEPANQYPEIDQSECDNTGGVRQGGPWANAVFANNACDGASDQQSAEPLSYIGCFRDDGSRDLNEGPHQYGYVPETCREACAAYPYFSLQNGGWCACGHKYGEPANQYPEIAQSECDNTGGVRQGGPWANAVFSNNQFGR